MSKEMMRWTMVFILVAAITAYTHPLSAGSSKPMTPIENYQSALQPDMRFLGKTAAPVKADWSSVSSGAVMEGEALVYVQTGSGNVVEKALIVRTYQIRGGPSTLIPDLDLGNTTLLHKGTTEIGSKDFSYAVLIDQGLIEGPEKKLIKNKGLLMHDCYLHKTYSGKLMDFFQKSKSQILYLERINNCRSANQMEAKVMNDFSARGDSYLRTLLGVSPSTALRKSEMHPGKDDTLETKLTTLKKLLDAGLITKEDYQKKKTQLLDEF